MEKASLFHAARELKSHKNVAKGLKIDKQVVTDKEVIEAEVVNFFTALFNGHHGSDLKNRGVPFVPDWGCLDGFLEDLAKISDDDQKKVVENIKKKRVIGDHQGLS